MEDDPKYERDVGPTVETTVFKHPDLETPKLAEPLDLPREIVEPPPHVAPPLAPTKAPPPACDAATCPISMPGVPTALLDVRDLSSTLLATFALGATVTLALMYFSRRKVTQDA